MNIKAFIKDIDYVTNKITTIRLYMRKDNGEDIIVYDKNFLPYLYVIPTSPSYISYLKKYISTIEYTAKIETTEKEVDLEKKTVLKVYTKKPSEISKLREHLKNTPNVLDIREYDIPFYKRYMFNNKLKDFFWYEFEAEQDEQEQPNLLVLTSQLKQLEPVKLEELNIVSFDIETIENKNEAEIIMISFYTNRGIKKVISTKKSSNKKTKIVKDEKELIKEFVKQINALNPDILLTYNGDLFDFEIIKKKSEQYKVPLEFGHLKNKLRYKKTGRYSSAEIKGLPHLDIFKFVSGVLRTSVKSETLSLDNIANEFLGEGKIDLNWEETLTNINDPETIATLHEYCLNDSKITLDLGINFFTNITSLSSITSLTSFDICRTSYGNMVESYALKKANESNVIVPNRPYEDTISERKKKGGVIGAYVVTPKPGLYKNVAVFDFRSLYPSIIISHNIDPFTFMNPCIPPCESPVPGYNYGFRKDKIGFIPKILKHLLKKRIKYKKIAKTLNPETYEYKNIKAKDKALKTILNAFYGYLGFVVSRWYRRECAQSVTAYGRYYINLIIKHAEEKGYTVVYGDTDSLFITSEKLTKKDINHFLKDINSKLPGVMELELENIYIKGLFVPKKEGEGGAKKRYVLMDKKGNLKIRGFEKVRRDWSKIAKELQENVMKLILENKKQEAIDYVRKTIDKIRSGEMELEKLIIYTKLSRPTSSYESIGPHVAAVKKAEARGKKIPVGSVIGYIITKGGPKDSISDKAELIEYAKNYDPEYYINHQIFPSISRILSIYGIKKEDLLNKDRQKKLGSFN